MIRSQEIALRCAAALPQDLLRGRWRLSEAGRKREIYDVSKNAPMSFVEQLALCSDDAARRLLLGRSR